VTKRGYIETSFYLWDASNRSEDVLSYGPEILDLKARDLTSQEVNELFLQARSDDSVGLESEQDEDSGYSELANLAVDEYIARSKRDETEARLARRLEERLAGDVALGYMGISPKACDLMITALQEQLDGVPEELARQRAELRRKAAELAPHNLIEMIGEPPARGRG